MDLAKSGDLIFLADHENGLRILDVADPPNPVEVGAWTERLVSSVLVADHLAFAGYTRQDGSFSGGLGILDITDPSSPVLLSTIPEVHGGIDVDGSFLYATNDDTGLRIIDISVPTEPIQVAEIPTEGNLTSVVVNDGFAYTTGWNRGLEVYDVVDPANPVHLQTRSFGRRDPTGVALSGGFLQVTFDGGDEVSFTELLRISPFIGLLSESRIESCCGSYVEGVHAAIADRYERQPGVALYDIRDPSFPIGVAAYSPPGSIRAEQVIQDGDHVYLAWGGLGLVILEKVPFDATLSPTLGAEPDAEIELHMTANVLANNWYRLEDTTHFRTWANRGHYVARPEDGEIEILPRTFGKPRPDEKYYRLRGGVETVFDPIWFPDPPAQ